MRRGEAEQEQEPLALSLGKSADAAVEQRQEGERAEPLLDLRGRAREEGAVETEDAAHAGPARARSRRGRRRERRAARRSGDVASFVEGRPGIGANRSGQALEQGRLAGAVGPDEAEDLARTRVEADAVQDRARPEFLRDAPDLEDGGGGHQSERRTMNWNWRPGSTLEMPPRACPNVGSGVPSVALP